MASLPVFFAGCGGGDDLPPPPRGMLSLPKVAAVPVAAKIEPAPYNYHGDVRRDPFVALNVETNVAPSSSEEAVVPNLRSLTLKGVYADGKSMAAIISGGGITYILRDRKLFDNRQRLVKGITGVIRNDSVIMIGGDHTTKELKLHEK
jgi:hypothetical protein